jgi:oxygen-dependent protoporphyrinogen oxidase
LLSWRGKWGLLTEPFRPPKQGQDDESVTAFATRRAGAEVAEIFADALATGIHAGDPRLLSVNAAFPRVAAMEREAGSAIKGFIRAAKQRRREAKARGEPRPSPTQMRSFREGLRLLVETLCNRLRKQPLFGVEARSVTTGNDQHPPQWTVSTSKEERWTADALVMACPAHCQAALLADLNPTLANEIAAIPYSGVAVVALGYRRGDVPTSLAGFGYIAPQRTRRDVLGVQWCSSIFPQRAPDGMVLLRALCGGWHRPEIVGWDDDRLLTAVRAELRLAMGIESDPAMHHIVRWHQAIPQYHVGHLERVAAIEAHAAAYPGLFLTGNAYHGVAMNDCTEQGEIVARRVAQYLLSAPTI